MRGTFKTETFNKEKLHSFITQLNHAGITFTEEWKRGLKTVNKDKADTLKLKHNGKIFFQQCKSNGLVIVENLPSLQREILLKRIKEAEFYTVPDFSLAAVLALVFFCVFAFYIFPGTIDYSKVLSGIIVVLTIIMCIGFGLLYRASGPTAATSSFLIPLLAIIPGVLASAPWSILFTPLTHTILRRSLYSQVNSISLEKKDNTEINNDR